jgi:hypothetical protein
VALAQEPYLTACLEVLRQAVLACRAQNEQKRMSSEETADLMHAVHMVPMFIQYWEVCNVDGLRECFAAYDRKWSPPGEAWLCEVWDRNLRHRQPCS